MVSQKRTRRLLGTYRTLLAVLLVIGPPASAQAGDQGDAVELLPGVVVDTAAGVAYVMSVDGGTEAVDLRSGQRRWRNAAAARPLLVTGPLLVAQAEPQGSPNDLRLVTLDVTRSGARVVTGAAELPSGVEAAVVETPSGEFEARASRVEDDVVVNWEYTSFPTQGMRPRREAERVTGIEGRGAGGMKQSGAVRMDLGTGVTSRILGVEAGPPRPRAVRLEEDRLAVPEPGEQFLSSDGRHVLVSERTDDDRTEEKFRWTIYEREGIRRVGQRRSHVSFSPFVIQGEQIVLVEQPSLRENADPEPRQLRAVSLSSGTEVWRVEVRDDEEHVSLPPE